jgi:hypothetical protein
MSIHAAGPARSVALHRRRSGIASPPVGGRALRTRSRRTCANGSLEGVTPAAAVATAATPVAAVAPAARGVGPGRRAKFFLGKLPGWVCREDQVADVVRFLMHVYLDPRRQLDSMFAQHCLGFRRQAVLERLVGPGPGNDLAPLFVLEALLIGHDLPPFPNADSLNGPALPDAVPAFLSGRSHESAQIVPPSLRPTSLSDP